MLPCHYWLRHPGCVEWAETGLEVERRWERGDSITETSYKADFVVKSGVVGAVASPPRRHTRRWAVPLRLLLLLLNWHPRALPLPIIHSILIWPPHTHSVPRILFLVNGNRIVSIKVHCQNPAARACGFVSVLWCWHLYLCYAFVWFVNSGTWWCFVRCDCALS